MTATLAHDSIMTPADVLKQRLQLSGYNNGLFCATRIAQQEGLMAFYRSLPITLAMNIPFNAILVSVNENMKVWYIPMFGNKLSSYFVCAGVAGGIAAALTTPLDIIKTRLQTQEVTSSCLECTEVCEKPAVPEVVMEKVRYGGITSALRDIWATQGFQGLFRGTMPRVLFFMPGAAISWSTYEYMKEFLSKHVI